MPLKGAAGGKMIASNIPYSIPDLFLGKSQAVLDLYGLLLGKLNLNGPIQKTIKEASVSFENRKLFASVLIRNRSIKLVLRANHKIASPRILSMERVAEKNYDHTILLESKKDIDEELIRWLEEAYITSN
jgi:hypothetical protein